MKQRDNEECGIRCPKCQSPENQVYDSRRKEASIMRRRRCLMCGFRFMTWETLRRDERAKDGKDG